MPRRRTVILVLGGSVLLLGGAIVALPSIVGAFVAPGLVRDAVAQQTGATVTVSRVRLGWTGDQRIDGLRVVDDAQTELARLDVRAELPLLSLLGGLPDEVRVAVGGAVRGRLARDGSGRIAGFPIGGGGAGGEAPGSAPATAPKPTPKPTPSGAGSADATLADAGVPRIAFDLDGLSVHLDFDDAPGTAPLVIEGLAGDASFDPATGAAKAAFATPPGAAGAALRVTIDGVLDDTLADARGSVRLDLAALPVPWSAPIERLDRLTLEITAPRLGDRAQVAGGLTLSGAGGAAATADLDLVLEAPFRADGSLRLAPDLVRGTIDMVALPTALIDPFLAATPVRLAADVGPALDAHLRLGAEAGDGADAGNAVAATVEATLDAERLRARLAGRLEGMETITVSSASLAARVSPDRLAALAAVPSARELVLDVQVRDARLPLDPNGAPLPDRATGTVEASLGAPWQLDLTTPALGIDAVRVAASRTAAAVPISLVADATADGLTIALGQAIHGDLRDPAALRAEGTLRIDGAPGATARALIERSTSPALAAALLEGGVAMTVTTARAGEAQTVAWTGTVGRATLSGSGRADAASWALDGATLAARLDDALLAAALATGDGGAASEAEAGADETPGRLQLLAPSTVAVTLDGVGAARAVTDPAAFDDLTLAATVTAEPLRLAEPSLPEPVTVEGLETRLSATLGATRTARLEGGFLVMRPSAEKRLVAVRHELAWDDLAAPTRVGGAIVVEKPALGQVEQFLGYGKRELRDPLGDGGEARLVLTPGAGPLPELAAELAFERLRGTVRATALDDGAWSVRSDGLDWTPPAAYVADKLDPPPAKGEPERVRIALDADPALRLAIERLHLPPAIDGRRDLRAIDARVRLTAQPIGYRLGDQPTVTMRDLAVDVRTAEAGAVRIVAGGQVEDPGAAAPGTMSLDALVDGLWTDDGTFSAEDLRVTSTGALRTIPTVLVDRVLRANGIAVAALGSTVEATVDAKTFSPNSGSCVLALRSPNGTLDASLRGAGNALRTRKEDGGNATLALTPALRERLLEDLHPIFADIRTTEQPLKLDVLESLVLPADGDLSRLKGKLRLTVGAVEFDGGSRLVGLFALSGRGDRAKRFGGHVDPLVLDIDKGVVRYDGFKTRLDKFEFVYSGTVDLVKRRVDLKFALPAGALGGVFEEVGRVLPPDFVVPLVTRGPIDDPKTELDPDFDLGKAAAEIGIQRGLEELLKKIK